MKRVLHSNKIIAFVGIAYLFSWSVWLTGIAIEGHSNIQSIWLFVLIGSFGPTVAAIVMTYIKDGIDGFKLLVASIFRFKFHIKYWLFFIFLLPAIWAIVYLVMGREAADPEVTGLVYITIFISPINALFEIFGGIGPIGEEIGWRGYLLERLLQKYPTIQANIILGFVWAFWHLPIVLFFPEFRDNVDLGLFLLLYPILVILLTTMMTNFWKWTNGSVFIAIWIHSMVNELLAYGVNSIWATGYSKLQLNLVSIGIFAILAIVSSLVFKKKANQFMENNKKSR